MILSETPETYGAEHLLTRRAVSPEVGEKLVALMRWWRTTPSATARRWIANPTPGNKAGGLTTILEKSLGAMAKAGSTNLVDVRELCRAGHQEGLHLHGHAGLRPGGRDRAGGGRRQPGLLHHRARQRVRLQAVALDQARDQHADVQAAWKTTWTSIAAPSWTARKPCSNAASAFST